MKSFLSFLIFLISTLQTLAVSPRFGNAGSVYQDSLVLFTGGSLDGPKIFAPSLQDNYHIVKFLSEQIFNDMFVYDLENSIFRSDLPSFSCPRVHHTSVLINDTLYLFGGAGSNNNIEYFTITRVVGNSVSGFWEINNISSFSAQPNGRYAHGADVVGGKMWIFGGFDGNSGAPLNDLWVFNPVSNRWTNITPINASAPSPRGGVSFHAIQRNGYDYLVLFGGTDNSNNFFNSVWGFNVNLNRWENFSPSTNVPPARALASSSVLGSFFVVFGGFNISSNPLGQFYYFDDLWYFDFQVDSITWERVSRNPQRGWPLGRSDAVSVFSALNLDFTIFSGTNSGLETLADIWTFNWGNFLWNQRPCYPGYEFPFCILSCAYNSDCSGNGICVSNGTNSSCICNIGWSGPNCDFNNCSSYRGFSSQEMNQVLLPTSIETIYAKLNSILSKLYQIRTLLPQMAQNEVNLTDLAYNTYSFYKYCLNENLCEVTQGFENTIGCQVPCGSETVCIENDFCSNGQCLGGDVFTNCSSPYGNNKCVNSWCDEHYGCMHKTVDCDDANPCTVNYCDSIQGCIIQPLNISDGDCCTVDQCQIVDGSAVITHSFKCDDFNPCTNDFCKTSCAFGKCSYECVPCCYSNSGQTIPLNPSLVHLDNNARPLGNPLYFTGTNNYPPNNSSSTAQGYFWLKKCDCELIYNITITNIFPLGTPEEGAAIYGPMVLDSTTNQLGPVSGIIHVLPRGMQKNGIWNFCDDGINGEDILEGKFYSMIHFCSGDIRANITFNPPCQ